MTSALDHIKTLAATGRSSEALPILDKYSKSARQRFEAIREDTTVSEEHRRRLLAVASKGVRDSLTDELGKIAGGAVKVDRDDAARVFGVVGLKGDEATLAMSRRDAADRVREMDGRELADALRSATRTGDEVMARAIAEKAFEDGNGKLLEQFINDRPELEESAVRLWNTREAERNTMPWSLRLADLTPYELSGMSAQAIDDLATSPVKAGAA